MKIAKNVSRLGTEAVYNIFAKTKKLAEQGKEIIDLSLGQSDFKSPKHVVNARDEKKQKRKTWRVSTFRRKAFSDFAISLQTYKIPLVGLTIPDDGNNNNNNNNQNTGYINGIMFINSQYFSSNIQLKRKKLKTFL